ncbi:glycoside hydrolase family 61 protein [Mycena maculata]|uniref:lytic cellulose monooxygenase (C4-dehydrogenating) n=1 Tax=Mycena maculata TaxID=230809 RepID=A0AAD7JGA8_9AGAR|nr:glycoside hydrolase family 61 protein [Mycena maculata]
MLRLSAISLLLLLSIPYVSAHGFVYKVGIATETYIGNIPNAEPTSSIVRQIDTVDPVKGANNSFLNCGQDAQLASNITEANPGDPMSFLWTGGDLSRWPHNIGPMLTYMTSCSSTDCTTFNSSQAKWFKIAQVGRIPGDSDGTWFQNNLYSQDGVPANVTLPANILPGAYLIRHEIIALHLATVLGGAEFYPSCSQILVTGSGTGAPTDDELVLLPGAYTDEDPGILVPDVFNTPPPPYTFPGPPIAAFVGVASSPAVSGSGSTPTPTVSASAPTSSSSSSTTGKTCKLKRVSNSTLTKREEVVPQRHLSRLVRGLAFALGGRTH